MHVTYKSDEFHYMFLLYRIKLSINAKQVYADALQPSLRSISCYGDDWIPVNK